MKTLFYYTFVERLSRPADTRVHLRAPAYLQIIGDHGVPLCLDPVVQSMAAATALAALLYALSAQRRPLWPWLLALAWAALVARFLLHPNTSENRYFYPNFIIVLIAAAEIAGMAFAAPRPPLAALLRRLRMSTLRNHPPGSAR